MLKSLFDLLDAHPSIYWAVAAVPTFILLGLIVSSLRSTHAARVSRTEEWLFAIVVVAFVIAWRWPFFFATHEYNPDESQLIVGAATLAQDPVFWRSVDGTTSGPLNFYALLPLHFLGLPLDFFTARLAASLLGGIALISLYRLFRSFASPAAARLASLPAIFFFATTTDGNFLHYSSEQVPVALLGLASFALLRRTHSERDDQRASSFGGIAAGLLPWAKLQTAPLGLALLGFKLWAICSDPSRSRLQKWMGARRLFLSAAIPSLVAVLAIVATGQSEHCYRNYLLQNVVYVGGGSSLAATLTELAGFVKNTHAFVDYFIACALLLLLAGGLYGRLRQRPQALFYFGSIYTATAIFCILAPRRPYPHYLILCVIPLACWTGASVCQLWPHVRWRRGYAVSLLAIGCVLPLGLRLQRPVPEVFGQFAETWRRPYSLAGTILRELTRPGESLGVWGWRNDLFVDSGLIQATRDPHTVWLINDTPNREYHRARYLEDLRRNRPEVFVDAVGPGAFSYHNRSEHAHEIFPALAAYIAQDYRLLVDLREERIFVRRDSERLSNLRLSIPKLQALDRKSRQRSMVEAPPPDHVEPGDLTGWDIDGRGVRSLHVPAKMSWALSGTEWQILLEYGLHPRAYTEGKSNGADIVVELQTAGQRPSEIFRRRLDPVRQPSDRGDLTTRLTLPPHAPGTQLVIRSEAGDFNDAAWDWVYFGRLDYLRSPTFTAEQFPGFSPLPDEAELPQAFLRRDNEQPALIINAPARLTYILEGDEKRMRFTIGSAVPLASESSPQGGPITVTVEHQNSKGAAVTLFQRTVAPLATAANRARTAVNVPLPPVARDDRLIVRMEAGPTTSGASRVYLTNVVLE